MKHFSLLTLVVTLWVAGSLLVAVGAIVLPQINTHPNERPVIALEAVPSRIDLGQVHVNDTLPCNFTLRNTGSTVLIVESTTSCGCLLVDRSAHVLHPQSTIEIRSEIETPKEPQQLLRSVHVHYRPESDEMDRRQMFVDIVGDVCGR